MVTSDEAYAAIFAMYFAISGPAGPKNTYTRMSTMPRGDRVSRSHSRRQGVIPRVAGRGGVGHGHDGS
jgi:hypothetical protein